MPDPSSGGAGARGPARQIATRRQGEPEDNERAAKTGAPQGCHRSPWHADFAWRMPPRLLLVGRTYLNGRGGRIRADTPSRSLLIPVANIQSYVRPVWKTA
jgi:hypothetical protein